MARWFSSDLHFGHANIIRFCDRPFLKFGSMDAAFSQDMTEPVNFMNETIINNINEFVTEEDELWLLGDLAMGNVDYTLKLPQRFRTRNLVLVAGNHDRCHPYNGTKHEKWVERYKDDTKAKVLHLAETSLMLNNGMEVVVNHFPFPSSEEARPRKEKNGKVIEDKFASWRPVDTGDNWLLCGHVHEKWRQQGRQINVGIDAWGGRPVSEEEIIELLTAGEQDLSRHNWVTPQVNKSLI